MLPRPSTPRQAAVTKKLLAARCNVDLEAGNGATALQVAERQAHAGIAKLIRSEQHKGADRAMKDTLLQVSPEQINKQQKDADRAMKEFLEVEGKDAAAAAAVSQKKNQAKKAGKGEQEARERDGSEAGREPAVPQ